MSEMATQPNDKYVVVSTNGVDDDSQDDYQVFNSNGQYPLNEVNVMDETGNLVCLPTECHAQNNKGKI